MWRLAVETVSSFWEDECPRLAAALAFYLVFALPALLTIIILIAATVVDRKTVTEQLRTGLYGTIGPAEAAQLDEILANAQQPGRGWWAGTMGIGLLLLSATGALQELQTALNRAWSVQPDSRRGRWAFLWKRLMSLLLLLCGAGLLLASLVASWILAEFGRRIDPYLPAWLSSQIMWSLSGLVSVASVAFLSAVVLKYMPDARLAWSDVWIGALLTSLLLVLGKLGLNLYFSSAAPGSAYGAAGALALVLLWLYYSAQVFLLGAEFTQVWARRRGRRISPEPGAEQSPAATARA